MANMRQREEQTGWLFMLPFLVSMTLFFLYAAGRTLAFSFTDFNLFDSPNFIGLRNYIDLLSDRLFLLALGNTLGFALIVTGTQTLLALMLAVQVNKAVRGKSVVRTVFYIPSIMSSTAMTLIFLWLFQTTGLLTQLVQFTTNNRWYIMAFVVIMVAVQALLVMLARRRYEGVASLDPYFLAVALLAAILGSFVLRLAAPFPIYAEVLSINWLNTQARFVFLPQTLWSVAMMNIFTTVPTLMLLFLAGLQSIPLSLYEAAKIDGANGFQRFRDITVPSIAPVTFAVVTLGIIGTLQMFDQVAVLGNAAPIESRVTLAYYIYTNAFPEGASSRIGAASAAAMILGLLTLAVVYLQRALGISDKVK